MILPLLLLAAAQAPQPAPPRPSVGERVQGATSPDDTPPAGAAQGPASALETLNGIYLVVNEEVVTLAEFYRELRRNGQSVTNEEERRRVIQSSHTDFVKSKLMTQAGRDLGFDPERVKALVDDDLKGFIEDAGSVSGFGAALKDANLDPETFREQRGDFYYRELWLRSVDGRDPGVSGRAYVDRFVRPGRLLYQFRRQPIEQLFPSRVQLQAILVGAAAAGSAQKALDLATALRERALGGEDFGKLAESYSADGETRRKGGLLPRTELARAKDAFPACAEFLESARMGAISEVTPHRVENELVGFLLLRVAELERLEGNEFADLEVQKLLRERDLKAQSDFRRERRLGELYRAAYVWPPEARPQPAATQPAGSPPASAPKDSRPSTGER